MKQIFIILSYFILILFDIGFAQSNEKRIKVVGDSLVGRTVNDIAYREVIGNVIITQGKVKITCNKAVQNLSENNALLSGHIIATQDTVRIVTEKGLYYGNRKYVFSDTLITLEDSHVVLTADTGYYYFELKKAIFNSNVQLVDTANILNSDNLIYLREEDKAVAVGNVSVSNNESVIYCDSLVYLRNKNEAFAYRNVKIENPKQLLTIIGDTLVNKGKEEYTRIIGKPLLTKIDSSNNDNETDTLFIRADMFESVKDSLHKLIATDSVKIIRGSLSSINTSSILYKDENMLVINKREEDKNSPVLWFENSQLVGDSITIFFTDKKLDSIEVRKNAIIISRNKTYDKRFDQISGDKINLYFQKGKLQTTIVKGNVLSIYYLYEDEKPNGLMKSSAGKVKMLFKDNSVINVSMYQSVQSEYHPENLVNGNELGFTLPDFVLYKNKPKKKNMIERE